MVDGDGLREELCRNRGFSAEDRMENIRRAGDIADGYPLWYHEYLLADIPALNREDWYEWALSGKGSEIHRGLCQHSPEHLRGAKSQEALEKGPRRVDPEIHGNRFSL